MRVASLWQCLALGSLFDYAAAIPASGVSQGKTSTITTRQDFQFALNYSSAAPGTPVKPGTKLRILCIGDSITVGVGSSHGNAWRARLRENLSSDQVVFAGTVQGGGMTDGYFAAWSGKTIKYMSDNIGPSLLQRPNIILIHAGTNDMNPNSATSTEGSEVGAATERLGVLIDNVFAACPDAVVVVAMIIDSCLESHRVKIDQFQALVPGIVNLRRAAGKHALAVNFTPISTGLMPDCLHPGDAGYVAMGNYWFDFMTQIPKDWITAPVGPDPTRTQTSGIDANGGLDQNIPLPNWGPDPVQTTDKDYILNAAVAAINGGVRSCIWAAHWHPTGKIALGIGQMGAWQLTSNQWHAAGQVAPGIGRDPRYIRLADMDGDGKADYVWLHPDTGMILCWLNKLPNQWTPAGSGEGRIGTGIGPAASIQLADMNGDGRADYLVIDPDNGSVRVWWNYGPHAAWADGWMWKEGGVIATGVPHANWKTLRFADINGDGRADYVYIGAGGSLAHWLNTGTTGGEDVQWTEMGGIASGDCPDADHLVLADIDGDGRDDYLVWDDGGGLRGYLNQRTYNEGVPQWKYIGPAKSIASGVGKPYTEIRLADMDGDGRVDYIHVGDNAAISVWYNLNTADTTMTMDGLRFADVDGDGLDDYIWMHPVTGAPYVYVNRGPAPNAVLGWEWTPLNNGQPIAVGAGRAATVVWGDINGDGKDDYLVIDPRTGAMTAYLNMGPDTNMPSGWRFRGVGEVASGLGRGDRVRVADIDGDGFDDYIFLKNNGGTTIYRNIWSPDPANPEVFKGDVWGPMPNADASGIFQRPEEITFHDLNGDGKADYVWTSAATGKARVWYNNFPNNPTWVGGDEIASGVGTSGSTVRWAKLQHTGRASYLAVSPTTGAVSAWLNGCDNLGPAPTRIRHGGPDTCLVVGYRQGSSSVYYVPASGTEGGSGVFLESNSAGWKGYRNGELVYECDGDPCNPLDIRGTWLRAADTHLKWDVFWAPSVQAAVDADCWCTVQGVEMKGVATGSIFTGFFYNAATEKCACEYRC